jgi:hypothetical protein
LQKANPYYLSGTLETMMRNLRRNAGLRFYGAIAFLIWALVPHYFQVLHAHNGGDRAHQHADISRADIQRAQHGHAHAQAPETRPEQGFQPSEAPGSVLLLSAADAGLHGHFGKDPNLAGTLLDIEPVSPDLPPSSQARVDYLAPALILFPLHTARGPPAPFSTLS